jgi:hypothetical protein
MDGIFGTRSAERSMLTDAAKQVVWVPNIMSQGLIWAFALLDGSVPVVRTGP